VRVRPIDAQDLHPNQREAVAKALATPDICLIQGIPVSGKSRVAAEIIARATARGDSVLLTAPQAATVDRTLELLPNNESVYAVRHLADGENAEALPDASRSLLPAERTRQILGQALTAAEQRVAETAQVRNRLGQDESSWPLLLELAERFEQLEEQASALARQFEAVPAEVEASVARLLVGLERETTEFPAGELSACDPLEADIRAAVGTYRAARARIEGAQAELRGRIEATKLELGRLTASQDSLAPLVEARAGRKWWTLAWWRALGRRDLVAQTTDLEIRVRQTRQELGNLEEEMTRLAADDRQAEEQERTERLASTEKEIARRRDELRRQEGAFNAERQRLQEKWRLALSRLTSESPKPATQTVEAVRAARANWQRAVDAAQLRHATVADWLAQLRQHPEILSSRLASAVNVVAAPLAYFRAEKNSNLAVAQEDNFDLLVLEHAEQITEAEFIHLAQRCRRWVLLAETSRLDPGSPPSSRMMSARADKGADHRSARPLSPDLFERLWSHLHCDPRTLPYAWVRESDDRLCCRLNPTTDEQRRWMETECVADHPDIQLRIVSPPRSQPTRGRNSFLAEVLFPPGTSIQEAKAFIFHELQELPIQARSAEIRWIDEANCLSLQFCCQADERGHSSKVVLAAGVEEIIGPSPTRVEPGSVAACTQALRFDPAIGWTREKAEDWVFSHLGLRDLGRTALLQVPMGIRRGLAAVVSDVVFGEQEISCDGSPSCDDSESTRSKPRSRNKVEPAVEFVPVPGFAPTNHRSNSRKSKPATGAGLEVDLADIRHRDRLPADLYERLKGARGVVNYLEAQAIVRALEGLVRSGKYCRDETTSNGSGSLVVLAFSPAQAQLIRLLMESLPELRALLGAALYIETPKACFERTYEAVLVSLTRSHTHRATCYGSEPRDLVTALTRARAKLILFGDVGTLARRVEWQGALDHLDATASAQERAILSRLLGYLQGRGRHAHAFQIRTGGPGNSPSPGVRAGAQRETAREGSSA
jgi:hypothetical protein